VPARAAVDARQNRLPRASLKDFGARFTSIVAAPGALRLHISPFDDRIIVERRTLDEGRERHPLGNLADSKFGDAQRAARIRLNRRQRALFSGAAFGRGVRGCSARSAPRWTRPPGGGW